MNVMEELFFMINNVLLRLRKKMKLKATYNIILGLNLCL